MSKLHELLAAEGSLETQAKACRTDLIELFTKKRHHFEAKQVNFTPSVEGEEPKTEVQSDIQTSVREELEWIKGHLVKWLDAAYQVAEANTTARADVVLEDDAGTAGILLVENVPATALLELEKRAAELQQLVTAIPTLDPAKGFQADEQRGAGYYRARNVVKVRTRKEPKVIVMYQATKEHPAQTQLIHVDLPIGNLSEQEWSSLITPAQKADMLNRCEMLTRALKRARSRANGLELDHQTKIAARLLDYVFTGKI